jgi:plastocyanin
MMRIFVRASGLCALACMLVLAGCAATAATSTLGGNSSGGSGSSTDIVNGIDCSAHSQTITMGEADFGGYCYTVSANQPVTLVDPASAGATHFICTGVQGVCEAEASAPADLAAPGFKIVGGQQHEVTFTTMGVYHVTCTVHPMMNVQVVVK